MKMSKMSASAIVLFSIVSGCNAYSYCLDHSKECGYWLKEGYCDFSSEFSNRTRQLCPVACGALPRLCDDTDEHCASWSMQGECTANPQTMLETCPVACGQAANVCVDTDENCASWAADGQCETNTGFMLSTCAVSCGVCKRSCLDKSDSCANWANEGQCESNPGHMLSECPVACEVCDSMQVVEDNDPKKCPLWARTGECTKNPIMMFKQCKKSCKIGEVVCGDRATYDECQSWAKEGRCDKKEDKDFMSNSCAGTCGICSTLERFYFSELNSGHDEL